MFLIPPYGTPGSDNWTDAKDAVGWTEPLGGVSTVSSPAKFSVSAEFNGGGGYLAHIGSSRNLSQSAFTIDGWVRFMSGTRSDVEQCWLSKWQPATGVAQSFLLYFGAASTSAAPNSINFDWRAGSSTYRANSQAYTFAFDQWYFVEVNGSSTPTGTLRFFVGGTLIAATSIALDFNASSSLDFWFGRLNHSSLSCRLHAHTLPFRVTNNVARHTADYEVPSGPFPLH